VRSDDRSVVVVEQVTDRDDVRTAPCTSIIRCRAVNGCDMRMICSSVAAICP
jgi:hypothetical protein